MRALQSETSTIQRIKTVKGETLFVRTQFETMKAINFDPLIWVS